jgi:hypothetical protein
MVTGPRARPSARHFILALFAALMLLACGAAAARAAQTEAPVDRLQVWNLNTHGMDTGSGPPPNGSPDPRTDYRQFINWITDPAHVAYYPDIVTLQEAGTQITGVHTASCHQFETDLEARTGHDYNCVETTQRGGAAIVYSTPRLTRLTNGASVQLVEVKTTQPGAGTCNPSSWYASTLRLRDNLDTSKLINAESGHLPTANYNDGSGNIKDCAWDNMKIMSPAVTNLGTSAMQIMAGDWNHPDATATNSNNTFSFWECWYQGVNTDLTVCGGQNFGWKDVMYRQCMAIVATEADRYSCMHIYHWTFGTSTHDRRDFLFTKTFAIYNQATVDVWPNPPYSDHRGQGALLKYY